MYFFKFPRNLQCEPFLLDAVHFSCNRRPRLIWNNFAHGPFEKRNLILQDYLPKGREALVKKVMTITTKKNSLRQGNIIFILL